MVEAIYSKQEAKILVNGDLTGKIDIKKGTQQGCPLSPLLFILTIEVLNNVIREGKNIRRITIKDQEYKLLAFADDLVVILEEPIETFKDLNGIMTSYGEVAGMKINIEYEIMYNYKCQM